MDEPIPTTHTLKEDRFLCFFEEWDTPPGKCMTLREKPSEYIMLKKGCPTALQPHFLATKWKQKREVLSCI